MIVTDDEELYHILLSIRAHGWTRNLPKHNLVCGEKGDDTSDESFRFVCLATMCGLSKCPKH